MRAWLLVLAACGVTVSPVAEAGETDTDVAVGDSDVEEPEDCPVLDCEDPTCADEFACTWPDVIGHESIVTFSGREIRCAFGPLEVPVDTPDCGTHVRVLMRHRTGGDTCRRCDRTYRGTFEYLEDTCSELLGEEALESGSWGFVFLGPRRRELWLPDAEGTWVKNDTLRLSDDGLWRLDRTDPVELDPPDCNNGVQYLGDLTIASTFEDQD
jgi:hypothetical protein